MTRIQIFCSVCKHCSLQVLLLTCPLRQNWMSCPDTKSLWHSNHLPWRACLMARVVFTRKGRGDFCLRAEGWSHGCAERPWPPVKAYCAILLWLAAQHDFWNQAISKTQQDSSRESPVNTLLKLICTKFGAKLWHWSPQNIFWVSSTQHSTVLY